MNKLASSMCLGTGMFVLFIILATALAVPFILLDIYVAQKYWEWFVQPSFGLGPIGFWQTFILVTFFKFICPNISKPFVPKKEEDKAAEKIYLTGQFIGHFVGSLLILLVGWLVFTYAGPFPCLLLPQ